MNYIKELNAFREWLLLNELPASAVSLWHTLMSINNVAKWSRKFNAPNAVVRQLSGLSKQGVLDARNKLIENGLINCEKGEKGRAPVYEMISFVEPVDSSLDSNLDLSLDQSPDRSFDRSAGESLNVLKHKYKHKQNETKERREEEGCQCDLFTAYEQNIGKLNPLVKDELLKWMEHIGEDIVLEAIKLTSKHNGRTFRYMERILIEWKVAGLYTVDAVIAYEQQKESSKESSKKNNTIPFQKSSVKKSLFDELREEASG